MYVQISANISWLHQKLYILLYLIYVAFSDSLLLDEYMLVDQQPRAQNASIFYQIRLFLYTIFIKLAIVYPLNVSGIS